MTRKAFTAVTVIFALIILFAVAYSAIPAFVDKAFEKAMNSMHKKQLIAENVPVTSEWLELKPEKPLETTKQVQQVQLLIEDYEHSIGKNDFGKIQLKDGTFINPEVEIIDENGKVYQLVDGHRVGNFVGFYPNKEIHGTSSFPENLKYTSIRIRSDKPFLCKNIYWYDFDMK